MKSFIMGKRLKALRREAGLSHADLAEELKREYGIEISVDSLKAYEVATLGHPRAYRNERMRVELLRYLADFYEVSADFILGNTELRSAGEEIRIACETTGLNETNILTLHGEKCLAYRECEEMEDYDAAEEGALFMALVNQILMAINDPQIREIHQKLEYTSRSSWPDNLQISHQEGIGMLCQKLGAAIGSGLERMYNNGKSD